MSLSAPAKILGYGPDGHYGDRRDSRDHEVAATIFTEATHWRCVVLLGLLPAMGVVGNSRIWGETGTTPNSWKISNRGYTHTRLVCSSGEFISLMGLGWREENARRKCSWSSTTWAIRYIVLTSLPFFLRWEYSSVWTFGLYGLRVCLFRSRSIFWLTAFHVNEDMMVMRGGFPVHVPFIGRDRLTPTETAEPKLAGWSWAVAWFPDLLVVNLNFVLRAFSDSVVLVLLRLESLTPNTWTRSRTNRILDVNAS